MARVDAETRIELAKEKLRDAQDHLNIALNDVRGRYPVDIAVIIFVECSTPYRCFIGAYKDHIEAAREARKMQEKSFRAECEVITSIDQAESRKHDMYYILQMELK